MGSKRQESVPLSVLAAWTIAVVVIFFQVANFQSVAAGTAPLDRYVYTENTRPGPSYIRPSKVGDSHSADYRYLQLVADYPQLHGGWLYEDESLLSTFNSVMAQRMRETNPLAQYSVAAAGGWGAEDILDPDSKFVDFCFSAETPLECELRLNRPTVCNIMIGTNNVSINAENIRTFSRHVDAIVMSCLRAGAYPLLYTIPPKLGVDVGPYNNAIVNIANKRRVIFVDTHQAWLELCLGDVLLADGVHLSNCSVDVWNHLTLIAWREIVYESPATLTPAPTNRSR